MRTTPHVSALALLLLVGCSRALPDPSPGSAIDPDGPTPKPIAVDVAMSGDPPLPGQSREGWPGLVDPEPSEHDHHHHHGHGKAAKPEQPEQPAKTEGGEHDHH
jgi:hypothetical protein